MWEVATAIAIVTIALVASGIGLAYRRFATARAEVLAYCTRHAPDISIEALTDTGIRVRVLGIDVEVDLAALLRRRPRGLPQEVWLEQVVAAIRAQVPLPEAPPLALVEDRILPLLKPASHADLFDRYPESHRLVWRPLAAGIAVTYVIAGTYQTTAVTRGTLAAWAIVPDDLHTRAVANLRVQTRHLLERLGGARLRYEHLDGFDATRILVADLIVPAGVADPLMAIPEESVLLIAPASERARLEAEAVARTSQSARPLSAALFRLGPEGPVLASAGPNHLRDG
jgi:hypothetical protein